VYIRNGMEGESHSVRPDAFSFRSGVTTMVDAGTCGWKDFPDFKRRIIQPANTRVLAMLNIVGAGMTNFGEHFELGIKDLVPMAVTEAVARVDKGFDRADIDAAWFGELTTTDGFPSGILADACGLLDITSALVSYGLTGVKPVRIAC
jgi:hypothetical protein